MKSIEEKSLIIFGGVKYRARKRFHASNFTNPYDRYSLKRTELYNEMANVYDAEIEVLKRKERHDPKGNCCPCCGQLII